MKYILFALLLGAVVTPAFSQKNWVEGTIFLSAGDTVRGNIDFRDWGSNPERVDFKHNGREVSYGPGAIRGFEIKQENAAYIGTIVTVDNSPWYPREAGYLNRGYTSTRIDTVFLKVLVSGSTSLYLYEDASKRIHFFIKHGSSNIEELLYKKAFIRKGSKYVPTKAVPLYRGQLKKMFGDCAGLEKKIEKSTYATASLTGIVEAFYTCRGESHPRQITPVKKSTKIFFSLVAGVTLTSVDFKGESGDLHGFNATKLKPVTVPTGGISVNFIPQRNREKISFSLELLYKSYKTSSDAVPFYSSIRKHEIELSNLQLNMSGRYAIVGKSISLQFIGGPVLTYHLKTDFIVTGGGGRGDDLFQKGGVGGIIGTGVVKKKWGLLVTFDKTYNTRTTRSSFMANTLRLSLSYKF